MFLCFFLCILFAIYQDTHFYYHFKNTCILFIFFNGLSVVNINLKCFKGILTFITLLQKPLCTKNFSHFKYNYYLLVYLMKLLKNHFLIVLLNVLSIYFIDMKMSHTFL